MLKNRELAKLYICRRCLNTYSKVNFKNYELKYKYYYYHFECAKCGKMHHIVKSVKPLYYWKMFFVKKPTDIINPEDEQFTKIARKKQRRNKIRQFFKL